MTLERDGPGHQSLGSMALTVCRLCLCVHPTGKATCNTEKIGYDIHLPHVI
jgi:hypothetical protein